MRFFSNKIYVNGASKNFNDIINDVAGGMKKQASAAAAPSNGNILKEAKEAITDAQEGKLPPALVKAIKAKEGKKGKNGKNGKKGKNPFGKKSSVDGNNVKIASVNKIAEDMVEIEFSPESTKVAEIEISDDGSVKLAGWSEGMASSGPVDAAAAPEGSSGEDNSEDESKDMESDESGYAESGESCEACGMSATASSGDFVKIANLTEKQKSAFRSYWQNVWPKEFIDAVLSKEQ